MYRRVFALQRRRIAAEGGLAARLGRWALAVAVLAALAPLVEPTFLWFLGAPPAVVARGLGELWFRSCLLVMVALSMDVHATVLRGPSREVLTLLPVQPRAVVVAELEAVVLQRLPWLVGVALLLSPVALKAGWGAWLVGLWVVLGAGALALCWATVAFLLAIDAAESPAAAPFLDALRGNNPRPQAALIYALAPGTLVGGVLAGGASTAAGGAAQGGLSGWLWGLGLWGLAGAAWPLAARLADRNWFRASVVLADIRARYAAIEGAQEALLVYLEWTVRWLPVAVARWALLELRYGWRERRGLISAMNFLGFGALVMGWSSGADGPLRAGLVGGVTAWFGAAVVVQRAASVPEFLRWSLPAPEAVAAAARAWAVVVWSGLPAAAALFGAWMAHGGDGAAVVGRLVLVQVLGAAVAGALCARLAERGVALLVAAALIGATVTGWWASGGWT